MWVLLVDDDPHLLETLKRGLTLQGHRVSTAGRRITADQLRAGTFPAERGHELVLLDAAEQEVDALELIRLLRHRATLPVVALIGLRPLPALRELQAMERVFLVRRPFDLAQLEQVLQQARRSSAC